MCRINQSLRRRELAFRMNDLRALLALGLASSPWRAA
jgi:hypothetical protein